MQIEIECTWDDRIHVRWTMQLDNRDGKTYRDLAEALEELPGVEAVHMKRYSCRIDVAPHVREAAGLVPHVRIALEDFVEDAEFTDVNVELPE